MREALEAISELGDGPAVRRLARQVTLAAQSDVPTLVVGEVGAGVPLVARAIHRLSSRRDQPCVTVPLAAWSEQEIDARLIPDHADREAPFHAAARGTLVLDRIDCLTEAAAAEVARRLTREPEASFRLVSSVPSIASDGAPPVGGGLFDLVNDLVIQIPPLRARPEDIPNLAQAALDGFRDEAGLPRRRLRLRHLRELQRHAWPGNLLELRAAMALAAVTGSESDPVLRGQGAEGRDGAAADGAAIRTEAEMRALERANLLAALEESHWRVSGPRGAAAILDVNPSTLASRMRRMNIRLPRT